MVFLWCRPPTLTSTGSSSYKLCLLFRVSGCRCPARHACVPSTFQGFLSSSRYKSVESTYARHPRPNSFRPQRFSRSRRFTPPLTVWTYFIPQPRPGFALQGFSPSNSRVISSMTVPSCRCSRLPANERTHQFQLAGPRLQGFDPLVDPSSKKEGLAPFRPDPFLRFQSSSGLSSPVLDPPSRLLHS